LKLDTPFNSADVPQWVYDLSLLNMILVLRFSDF
jgi:hypothetical protein